MLEFGPAVLGPRRAVFLDRDGVLIANRNDYVRTTGAIELLPDADAAVRCLTTSGFAVVVVSNQAAVGRGLMTEKAARTVHSRVIADFAARGAYFTAGYLCPHAPADGCDCRKPRPGLIQHAAARLNIDLTTSYLIGDSVSDLEAATAAGVQPFLVLTGRGREQATLPGAAQLAAGHVQPNVLSAAQAITTVARRGQGKPR